MRMPTAPTSSLVVSTYNWPAALDLVLRSVLAQRQLPGQVVVADDGSGEETRALIAGFVPEFARLGVPLEHAWQEDRGFRKSRILNAALARVTGDYVLMIDGDIVLHPEWVRSHLRAARPGYFVQGSRALLRPERTREALARGEYRFSVLDRGLKNAQNALHLPLLAPLVRSTQNARHATRGCNFALWRADALRVNGYDEAFEGWGREDSEFAARLLNAGVRRRRLKFAAVCYHLWHPERAQTAVPEQERMLDESMASGVRWCERGLSQHLPVGETDAGAPATVRAAAQPRAEADAPVESA
jgi:glycosyltransferase involved in cell wall biosynthesis